MKEYVCLIIECGGKRFPVRVKSKEHARKLARQGIGNGEVVKAIEYRRPTR
jgi:hypothetical protein